MNKTDNEVFKVVIDEYYVNKIKMDYILFNFHPKGDKNKQIYSWNRFLYTIIINTDQYRNTNTDYKVIKRIISGEIVKIDITVLARLCDYLDCDINDLFEFKSDNYYDVDKEYIFLKEKAASLNDYAIKFFNNIADRIQVLFLTPSKYQKR